MSVGQLVRPSVSPLVGPLVRATRVTFPNFLLIKISLGQMKVNSSNFRHAHGIDEEMDKKKAPYRSADISVTLVITHNIPTLWYIKIFTAPLSFIVDENMFPIFYCNFYGFVVSSVGV